MNLDASPGDTLYVAVDCVLWVLDGAGWGLG